MRKPRDTSTGEDSAPLGQAVKQSPLPLPSAVFRRRAWIDFQRALDPLAPPKPLRTRRH